MVEIRGERLLVPNSVGVDPPKTAAPVGAVDCHHHIFDRRFPVVPGRSPHYGTVADYLLLRRRLGLSRSIVVSPSSYGFDNRCLIDALQQLGDTSRGVAAVDTDVTDDELRRLHGFGVRGIRLNFGRIAKTSMADVVELADRIKFLNWHLQLHMPPDDIVANESTFAKLPVTLVVDHYGRARQPGGLEHPIARTLGRLLEGGNTYVKLAFYYESEAVKYSDFVDLSKYLIAAGPHRTLWGSDWNHANMPVKPDDAVAFDQLAIWAPDAAARKRILVDNPDALYWRD